MSVFYFSVFSFVYGILLCSLGRESDWEQLSDAPGVGRVSWSSGTATPYVRYDYDLSSEARYRECRLEWYGADYGRDRSPDLEADAREYRFKRAGEELLGVYAEE